MQSQGGYKSTEDFMTGQSSSNANCLQTSPWSSRLSATAPPMLQIDPQTTPCLLQCYPTPNPRGKPMQPCSVHLRCSKDQLRWTDILLSCQMSACRTPFVMQADIKHGTKLSIGYHLVSDNKSGQYNDGWASGTTSAGQICYMTHANAFMSLSTKWPWASRNDLMKCDCKKSFLVSSKMHKHNTYYRTPRNNKNIADCEVSFS